MDAATFGAGAALALALGVITFDVDVAGVLALDVATFGAGAASALASGIGHEGFLFAAISSY